LEEGGKRCSLEYTGAFVGKGGAWSGSAQRYIGKRKEKRAGGDLTSIGGKKKREGRSRERSPRKGFSSNYIKRKNFMLPFPGEGGERNSGLLWG